MFDAVLVQDARYSRMYIRDVGPTKVRKLGSDCMKPCQANPRHPHWAVPLISTGSTTRCREHPGNDNLTGSDICRTRRLVAVVLEPSINIHHSFFRRSNHGSPAGSAEYVVIGISARMPSRCPEWQEETIIVFTSGSDGRHLGQHRLHESHTISVSKLYASFVVQVLGVLEDMTEHVAGPHGLMACPCLTLPPLRRVRAQISGIIESAKGRHFSRVSLKYFGYWIASKVEDFTWTRCSLSYVLKLWMFHLGESEFGILRGGFCTYAF
jgi:hypothetical protein